MRTMMARGAGVLVAGLVLMSSACALGGGAGSDTRQVLDPDGGVHLNVTNQSGGPMELYAVGSGTFYRIGRVEPGLDGRFAVRPGMIVNGAVELIAKGDNGLVVRSGPVLLAPGSEVDFDLAAHVATSSATVRGR